MKRLQSRQRVRFTPTVEALEDRSLLNASATAPVPGTGQVVTTGAVNTVEITDDGQLVRVFSDNGLVGVFSEGTAVTVTTNNPGSRNNIFYVLQGVPASGQGPILHSNLFVNFGFGPGSLFVSVVSFVPSGPGGPVSGLDNFSSVQITTITTPPPPRHFGFGFFAGTTQESLNVGSIGLGASLNMMDFGGAGNNSFTANLSGLQEAGSKVSLSFFGGGGHGRASVIDTQDIAGSSLESGQPAAGTFIGLDGGSGNDVDGVLYTGLLLGGLAVIENGGGGPGNDNIGLTYGIAAGSPGSLFSAQKGGPGNDILLHSIRVAPGNAFPDILQASTDGGPGGFDHAFIGPLNVVRLSNVEEVTSVL
jgi:hypothetical protein